MRLLKRLVGVFFCLLGLTGLLACVAGVVGCWYAYSDVLRRSERLFGKGEEALGVARKDLVLVRDRVRETQQRLNASRQREADFAAQPEDEQRRRRLRSRDEVGKASPQLRTARAVLVTSTEAALVLDGLLGAVADLPGGERVGLDSDRVSEASDRLSEATDQADDLAVLLARKTGPLTPEELEVADRIAGVLDRVIEIVDEGIGKTDRALERVKEWHARFGHILFWSAVGLTVVLVWIALGQFSLMVHGFSWARGRRPEAAGGAGTT